MSARSSSWHHCVLTLRAPAICWTWARRESIGQGAIPRIFHPEKAKQRHLILRESGAFCWIWGEGMGPGGIQSGHDTSADTVCRHFQGEPKALGMPCRIPGSGHPRPRINMRTRAERANVCGGGDKRGRCCHGPAQFSQDGGMYTLNKDVSSRRSLSPRDRKRAWIFLLFGKKMLRLKIVQKMNKYSEIIGSSI